MSSAHFLRHLSIAYNHFHPIDEHRKFAEQLDLFEKKRLRDIIYAQLGAMERRCRVSLGREPSEELGSLLERIKSVKGRLDVLSHEGAPVV